MVPLLSGDARSGNTVQRILLMMPHNLVHMMGQAERHSGSVDDCDTLIGISRS